MGAILLAQCSGSMIHLQASPGRPSLGTILHFPGHRQINSFVCSNVFNQLCKIIDPLLRWLLHPGQNLEQLGLVLAFLVARIDYGITAVISANNHVIGSLRGSALDNAHIGWLKSVEGSNPSGSFLVLICPGWKDLAIECHCWETVVLVSNILKRDVAALVFGIRALGWWVSIPLPKNPLVIKVLLDLNSIGPRACSWADYLCLCVASHQQKTRDQ